MSHGDCVLLCDNSHWICAVLDCQSQGRNLETEIKTTLTQDDDSNIAGEEKKCWVYWANGDSPEVHQEGFWERKTGWSLTFVVLWVSNLGHHKSAELHTGIFCPHQWSWELCLSAPARFLWSLKRNWTAHVSWILYMSRGQDGGNSTKLCTKSVNAWWEHNFTVFVFK